MNKNAKQTIDSSEPRDPAQARNGVAMTRTGFAERLLAGIDKTRVPPEVKTQILAETTAG
ncbi:MAG: hypothetical protein U0793_33205 [Gemmataceae bacterium]